jgi:threonine aldolase
LTDSRCLDDHFSYTSVVSLENTHNVRGGRVLTEEYTAAVRSTCDDLEDATTRIRLHLDGARVCNAAVASGRSLASLSAPFDSVTCCLSKGMGAPAGTLLMGEAKHVRAARRLRKQLGGGMRQVGVLAAAGIVALSQFPAVLAADHANAKEFARAVEEGRASTRLTLRDQAPPETNMVYLKIAGDAEDPSELFGRLNEEFGVKADCSYPGYVRTVFHRDLPPGAVERLVSAFKAVLG